MIVLENNDDTNKTLYMLYQTKLSPSDKFDLLLKSLACQVHGAITSLANEFSLSRKTIYSVRYSILNLFKELSSEKMPPKNMVTVHQEAIDN